MNFSDYIVYADESGDHSLVSIDPQFPVFALVFCLIHKVNYTEKIVPSVLKLKFDFWGHDSVVLRSHDIRKAENDFNILLNSTVRARFIASLTGVITAADFTIIAAAIDKHRLVKKYAEPADPYGMALAFCMERLYRCLAEWGQGDRLTFIQVERRGKVEDAKLELEFRRICDGQSAVGKMPNLDIRFMDKKHNSTGLQLADLVAHPIGRHVINPRQGNQAYDALEPKFRRGPDGKPGGYGLKIFP